MSLQPLKGTFKPSGGYVCLSCLFKQTSLRPRRSFRYQSTTTQAASAQTSDTGFAVEGGALRHALGVPSNDHSKTGAHAATVTPRSQKAAKGAGTKGKKGNHDAEASSAKPESSGQEGKQKQKQKQKKKKATSPPAGDAPATGKVGMTPNSTTKAGKATSNKKPKSSETSISKLKIQTRNRRPRLARPHSAYDPEKEAKPKVSVDDTEGLIRAFQDLDREKKERNLDYVRHEVTEDHQLASTTGENERAQPSKTPVPKSLARMVVAKRGDPNLRKIAAHIATLSVKLISDKRSLAETGDVLKRVRDGPQNNKVQKRVEKTAEKVSATKKALEAALIARKGLLEGYEPAEKDALASRAKSVRKVASARNLVRKKPSDSSKTVSIINGFLRSQSD